MLRVGEQKHIKRGFKVNYHECSLRNLQIHTHEYTEIIYCVRGTGVHTINDSVYKLTTGALYYVKKDWCHEIRIKEDTFYYDVLIGEKFFDTCVDIRHICSILGESEESACIIIDARIRQTFENMLKFFSDEQTLDSLKSESALENLLIAMLRFAVETGKPYLTYKGESQKTPLPVLIDYINKNFTEPELNLNTMAKLYNYNASYLSRIFKRVYGIGFNDYVRQLRLEKAKDFLLDTDFRISFIEGACGFKNHSSFYNSFSEKYGSTPNKYRQKHRLTIIRLNVKPENKRRN